MTSLAASVPSGSVGPGAQGEPGRIDSAAPVSPPRNIIIMIGDGMGFEHVAASGLHEHGHTGTLVYERFPVRLAMTTYPAGSGGYDPARAAADPSYVEDHPTDSAAAATSLSTGVKTLNRAIGIDADGRKLRHLQGLAEEMGKATGVVTTVQLSHATPAGFVAHVAARDDYAEIARQMLLESGLDVVMGCGHPWYDDDGRRRDEATEHRYVGGAALWQSIEAGVAGDDADGDGRPDPWRLIQTRAEFQALAAGGGGRILGVAPAASTLQQERRGNKHAEPFAVPLNPTQPSLAEMAAGALSVLGADPDGFFVMIEGGAIDWAAHDNQSGRLIEEMADFNRAVEAVLLWLERRGELDRSLIIVTADHETGYLALGGAPTPGRDADRDDRGHDARAGGDQPRLRWGLDGHTNSLVPLYARGPGAERVCERAIGHDAVRGAYLDNTDVARVCFELWGGEPSAVVAPAAAPESAPAARHAR